MEILGVGSTTIKRWANENKLRYVRTAAGHRRFRLADVEALLRPRPRTPGGDLIDVQGWIQLLSEQQDAALIRDALLELRHRLGNWYAAADLLGEVLEQIGIRWTNNELSIVEEHIATGLLDQALASVVTSMQTPADAPACLLATLNNEWHTLGLSLARLCVGSSGFKPLWVGANTPVNEIVDAVAALEPAVVALSASAWSSDAGTLGNACRAIETACGEHGARLVLGGRGAWPEEIADCACRCHSFGDLRAVLEGIDTGG